MPWTGRGIAALVMAAVLAWSAMAAAQGTGGDEPPVLFTADQVTYDEAAGIVEASGNVEVSREDRVLLADVLTYNQITNLITARGNLSLLEPSGEVVFADRLQITGDLKNGIIEDFRAILSDGALFAAAGARRSDGNLTEMVNAVYSPCYLCPENPTAPPLWQLKAVKVTHDQQERQITVRETWIEIDGVPVLYTPYLSFPDPTVKRRSGFLAPTFGISSDLGGLIKIPYYFVLSDHADLTLAPAMATAEGPLLEGEYRQLFKSGEIEASGSITRTFSQRTRGHIFSRSRFDLDENWRVGSRIDRSSDRTYLRKYGYSNNERSLTSRLYGEGFFGRSYFVANAYNWDSLDSDVNQNTVPWVVPLMNYDYIGEPDALGGRFGVQANVLSLFRDKGNDTQRLSARANWQLPIRAPLGQLVTVKAALWADGYNVQDLQRDDTSNDFNGVSGRIFPQGSIRWQWPFVSGAGGIRQVIEPTVEFVAAPSYGNSSRIPNNDSEDVFFDESNIFGLTRFPGIDQVEEGVRVNYGLKWSAYGIGDASASAFVGQVYRFDDTNQFPTGSGLNGNSSDVVSAFTVSPGEALRLTYRNRVDPEGFHFRRHELAGALGLEPLFLAASYVMFDSEEDSEFDKREEVDFSLHTQWTRHWRSRIFGVRDLTGGGTQREIGVRLTYEDECLFFSAEYARQDIEDKDVKPSDAVFFRIGLKTLGSFGTGFDFGGGRADDRYQ